DFRDIFSRLQLIRPRRDNPPDHPAENPAGLLADNLIRDITDDILFVPGFFKRKPEQLDLSEWVHVATQGRDHYVRIVYEGELWPFRHRAALIKVTERKFMQPKDGSNIIGAYLMQRMFIVVREPLKRFTNRGSPFRQVR